MFLVMRISLIYLGLNWFNSTCKAQLKTIDYDYVEIGRLKPLAQQFFIKEINNSSSKTRKDFDSVIKKEFILNTTRDNPNLDKKYPAKVSSKDFSVNIINYYSEITSQNDSNRYIHLYRFLLTLPLMFNFHDGVEMNSISCVLVVKEVESYNFMEAAHASWNTWINKKTKPWRKLKSYRRKTSLQSIEFIKLPYSNVELEGQ